MLESGSDLDSEERGGEGTGLDLVRVILRYGNRKLAQNHNQQVYGWVAVEMISGCKTE